MFLMHNTIIFYIQGEDKKAAPHNCSAESIAPACWYLVDTTWAGFGPLFWAEPCGEWGHSRSPELSEPRL